ncbi:hypothetical protein IHQ71_28330 [Rhizobium sp. TH2]|uniref:hypothetical protein n=1 Tax=Rhizobium sp. TH2 TaxID=2775403 RepID=UPI00215749F7|nr:hypothetical protein [Rhizobium sp. TH2]UVC08973.1 hypothetical protein IHQ71_28330 [Rhizobium sp. TH2]
MRMDEALDVSARAANELRLQFHAMLKDGTIHDIISGSLGENGNHVPDVTIHLAQEQEDERLAKALWADTGEQRERGNDVGIFFKRVGRDAVEVYRGRE